MLQNTRNLRNAPKYIDEPMKHIKFQEQIATYLSWGTSTSGIWRHAWHVTSSEMFTCMPRYCQRSARILWDTKMK